MVNAVNAVNVKLVGGQVDTPKKQKYTVRGKGSFGCVVDPPFDCNNAEQNEGPKQDNKKNISKIFYRPNNALDEMDVYTKLDGFDKDQQFSIKPKKMCRLNLSKVDKNLLKECEFEDNMNANMKLNNATKQIIYEDGGLSLTKFISSTTLSFEEFAEYAINLFKALVALNEAELVHFDIKLDNIVVDIEKKGKEARIIDFAYCRTIDFVKTHFGVKSSFVWKRMVRSYFTYPMEFLYIPLLHEIASDNALSNANEKRNAKIFESLQEKIAKTYTRDKRASEFYNHLIYELSSKRYTFFSEATTDIEEATDFFRKHTPEKIDVFSLGMTLYQVYGRFLSKKQVRDPVMCEKLVFPLLERMTHPFVKKRALPAEALQEWENIISVFKNKNKN